MLALLPFVVVASTPLVLITVDDLSADSLGSYGCPVEGTSPQLDAFAADSRVFRHAHVQVGNCMPSRNVMMSGYYPFQNGVEGFRQITDHPKPTLCEDLAAAGYFTAIRGKALHSTPYHPFPTWDLIDDLPSGVAKRQSALDKKDPASFGNSVRVAAEAASAAGKPLFLNINISDPHKPFYSGTDDPNPPSKIFTASEIVVPGFLVPLKDDPRVREEVAMYYSSVRRADDAFGAIVAALKEANLYDEAVIVFLSDHGMPLPFAKTQLYYHSTRTPLMVRGPGVTAGEDARHVVSAVDLMPTMLDAIGASVDRDFAGRSFATLLDGGSQDDRDHCVLTYFENSGRNRHPMRAVRTRDWSYLFNPWSDGVEDFATATDSTASYQALRRTAAKSDVASARLQLMDHRVREELYHDAEDPDALTNLIDEQPEKADELRAVLLDWMREQNDPLADVFASRSDEAIAAYMKTQTELEDAIKTARQKKRTERLEAERKPNAIRRRVAR